MPWSKIGPYPGAYYKEHLACFTCRKMVRKRSGWELPAEERQAMHTGQIKCPDCGQPLAFMGKAFRPPRQTATKQWRKVEQEYRQGTRWVNGRW
jgi:DNA-directed RNA polymerase subunit RPC12/RpoP